VQIQQWLGLCCYVEWTVWRVSGIATNDWKQLSALLPHLPLRFQTGSNCLQQSFRQPPLEVSVSCIFLQDLRKIVTSVTHVNALAAFFRYSCLFQVCFFFLGYVYFITWQRFPRFDRNLSTFVPSLHFRVQLTAKCPASTLLTKLICGSSRTEKAEKRTQLETALHD
jgi:hypothetical protein